MIETLQDRLIRVPARVVRHAGALVLRAYHLAISCSPRSWPACALSPGTVLTAATGPAPYTSEPANPRRH